MSALTFGMLIGAVLISTLKLKIKIVLLLFPSLFSVGIIFFLMYIYESFPFYIISFLLIGLFINLTNINLISLLQKIIPRNISGKVFGLLTSASVSAQPISYGIMGFLVDILKPEGIILICFVAFIIISFIFLNIKELKVETLN